MRRSMSRPLPELADPIRLCAGGGEYSGTFALADFDRLVPGLADAAGEVSFTMRFERDPSGINAVRGKLDTTLNLLCERCAQAFDLPVQTEWQLGAVSSLAEADRLPEGYEPLLVGEELTRLKDVLEDCCWHCRRFRSIRNRKTADPPRVEAKKGNQPRTALLLYWTSCATGKTTQESKNDGCSKKQKVTFNTRHAPLA